MSGRIAAGIYPNLKFKFLPGLAFSEMNLPKKTEFSDFVVTSENVLGKTFHILPQFNCFTKSFYGLWTRKIFLPLTTPGSTPSNQEQQRPGQ